MPMGRTSSSSYIFRLSLTVHNSAVHTLVKARGKKSNKTWSPRNEESVTGLLSVSYKVKSGACCPDCNAIILILSSTNKYLSLKFHHQKSFIIKKHLT